MTDIQHPAWCSPRLCDVTDPALPMDGSSHRSEPIDLGLNATLGPIRVATASLVQASCPWPTDTFLVLAGEGDQIDMRLSQAAGILVRLNELVSQGEVTRP
jgi:hypothetical protein